MPGSSGFPASHPAGRFHSPFNFLAISSVGQATLEGQWTGANVENHSEIATT